MKREGEGWGFYRGDTPVARGGATGPPAARGLGPAAGRPWAGRQALVARWGGDGAFFFPGTSLRIWKKKLHLKPVALWGATGGYFWNISKRTYIFEIFILKKYKKNRFFFRAGQAGHDQAGPVTALPNYLSSKCRFRWCPVLDINMKTKKKNPLII